MARTRRIPQPSAPLPPERAFHQMPLGMADPDGLESRFQEYHRRHPEVFDEFRRMALRLHNAGVRHYGAGAIFEAIRFHRAVDGRLGDDGDAFKVNNSFRSRYSRKLVAEDPARWEDFFSFRKLRSA